MKILGRTPQNGSILELSPQETDILGQLQVAMDDADFSPEIHRRYPIEGNLDKAFIAIMHFIEVKFAINRLRILAEELDESIGIK